MTTARRAPLPKPRTAALWPGHAFGLTVWGWGTSASSPGFPSTYVSYAYPAGASVQPINEVAVRPDPG